MSSNANAASATGKSQGQLYVVCAASGTGKTSLVQGLVERETDVWLSVSHTTRAPRAGEHDGVHYHFIDPETFERMVAEKDFLEHAKVYGNYYGTSESAVRRLLADNRDVLLEIDWQGARQVRERIPECLSVFILPPSLDSLRARLKGRGKDSMEVIEGRLAEAIEDISHYGEFDFLVVNDNYDVALEDLRTIVRSQRLDRERQQSRYADLIAKLLAPSNAA